LLFVINSLAGGGAERVFSTVLAGLEQPLKRYDVHVALLDREPSAYALPSWVRVHQLDCRRSLVKSIRQLSSLAVELKPRLLFSFLTRANVAAVASAKCAGCPVIVSERNDTTAQLAHGRLPSVARAVVKLAYRRAEMVIAVSTGLREALVTEYRVERERITVINNPVDAARIQAAGQEAPAIEVRPDDVAMLARLEPQKNLHLAIRAFAQSGRAGRLVILGEGSLRTELQTLAETCGLRDRVIMPGYVANPFAVLARASAFLLTSRHEGFCNSLLEAMALGLPVLASDCRFSPAEILEVERPPQAGEVIEGRGGLLVRVDDLEGLASGLRMLENGNLRARLGQLGAERIQAFTVTGQIAQYREAIEGSLAEQRAIERAQ
jgi:glycosyltransferase involved in cell wall biosynthesis